MLGGRRVAPAPGKHEGSRHDPGPCRDTEAPAGQRRGHTQDSGKPLQGAALTALGQGRGVGVQSQGDPTSQPHDLRGVEISHYTFASSCAPGNFHGQVLNVQPERVAAPPRDPVATAPRVTSPSHSRDRSSGWGGGPASRTRTQRTPGGLGQRQSRPADPTVLLLLGVSQGARKAERRRRRRLQTFVATLFVVCSWG